MPRIRRLSTTAQNQIAAGEVVERPASVVKELLENAVDAGAERIVVTVDGGGVERIVVIDDGGGMSREDAELSVERHATSKIREVEDLLRVSTLGFRGEALPSIASVSRFRLTTCEKEESEGTQVIIDGGGPARVHTCSAAPGTEVEVRDLFFNVPARRKFLKRAHTELAHVSDVVERLALARPAVAFRLSHEERLLFDIPKVSEEDEAGRLARILGRGVGSRLIPVQGADRRSAVTVRGFVSPPDLHERTARSVFAFVNGRFVRDRTIQHAVTDAYRGWIPQGRHPVVVLWIELPPERVDVNVHPQKIEVRFVDTSEVHRAVALAVQSAFSGGLLEHAKQVSAYSEALGTGLNAREVELQAAESAATAGGFGPWPQKVMTGAWRTMDRPAPSGLQPRVPSTFEAGDAPRLNLEHEVRPLRSEGRFSSLEPLGVVMSGFLVLRGVDRLVLVDLCAARQRLAFERMKSEHKVRAIAVQPLLFPEAIDLDPVRQALLEAEQPRLLSLGFDLAPFGERTWLLRSVPSAVAGVSAVAIVTDLLDELMSTGGLEPELREERLMIRAADSFGARARHPAPEELRFLLESMDQLPFGSLSPRGRPTHIEWTEAQLAKLFRRP